MVVFKGYCFSCKKKVTITGRIKNIKRKLNNGRNVTIKCGACEECNNKVCVIVSNK